MESIGARCRCRAQLSHFEARWTNSASSVLCLQELATVTYERKKKSQVAARWITLALILVWPWVYLLGLSFSGFSFGFDPGINSSRPAPAPAAPSTASTATATTSTRKELSAELVLYFEVVLVVVAVHAVPPASLEQVTLARLERKITGLLSLLSNPSNRRVHDVAWGRLAQETLRKIFEETGEINSPIRVSFTWGAKFRAELTGFRATDLHPKSAKRARLVQDTFQTLLGTTEPI